MRKLLTLWIALAALIVALVSPVSAQSPLRAFPPGTFQSRAALDATSGGGGRTCTDDTASANFLARTGGSAPNHGAGSTHYADAICTFIKALETAGLITGNLGSVASCGTILDAVWLLKAHTSTNAGLNICGTGFTLVNHGATFTADVGYTGAPASYVDTRLQASGTNYVQNSASFFAGTSTNFVSGTDYKSLGAVFSGSFVARIYPHFTDNNFYYSAEASGANLTAPTPGHLYGYSRSGASTSQIYVDATGTADTTGSASPILSDFILVADDSTGTNPFAGTETFALIGANITGTQEAALQSAYAAYVASVP
jgi:hypothetical protein